MVCWHDRVARRHRRLALRRSEDRDEAQRLLRAARPELLDHPTAVAVDRLLVPVVEATEPLDAVGAAGQLDFLTEHLETRAVEVVDDRVLAAIPVDVLIGILLRLRGQELQRDPVGEIPTGLHRELLGDDVVRQGNVGTVLPLADLTARESRSLVDRRIRLGAGQTVELGNADDLPHLRVGVEDGVLNARLGELALVRLVVEAEIQLLGRRPDDVAAEHVLVDAAVVLVGRQAVDVAVAEQARRSPLGQ